MPPHKPSLLPAKIVFTVYILMDRGQKGKMAYFRKQVIYSWPGLAVKY